MHLEPKEHARFGWRVTIAGSLLAALVATGFAVFNVSLFPPHLQKRALEIGAASTTILVDTPHSAVTNLGTTSDDFASLQAQAALLGNMMTTDPVKTEYRMEWRLAHASYFTKPLEK